MMAMGAVTARLKAYDRRARRAYDASCLALRDGALTGACYLQRDAAKLYAGLLRGVTGLKCSSCGQFHCCRLAWPQVVASRFKKVRKRGEISDSTMSS